MRILHTSDWHLGRSFHREGLLGHQGVFMDHLLDVVRHERVDVVVVAGDIYDRALPQVDAVALLDETLARLSSAGVRTVLTSGNHDSAGRLGFASKLMDAAGVHVRARPSDVGRPLLLADEHGEVAFHPLPYLDPTALLEPWGLPARSHETVLSEAMRRVRADLDTRVGARSVVLAHAFVAGAQPSESERDISVGGVSRVPTSVFADIDYVALGHLHGPHTLTEHMRYSGSPLAYSFGEASHRKGSWLVDLGAHGVETIKFVDAPRPRALACVSGTLESLLTDPDLAAHETSWVQATITDALRPAQAMSRLRQRFPHTLVIVFAPQGATPSASPRAQLSSRSDHEITLDFVRDLRGVPATDSEAALLLDAVDACCHDPDADPVSAVSPR